MRSEKNVVIPRIGFILPRGFDDTGQQNEGSNLLYIYVRSSIIYFETKPPRVIYRRTCVTRPKLINIPHRQCPKFKFNTPHDNPR